MRQERLTRLLFLSIENVVAKRLDLSKVIDLFRKRRKQERRSFKNNLSKYISLNFDKKLFQQPFEKSHLYTLNSQLRRFVFTSIYNFIFYLATFCS